MDTIQRKDQLVLGVWILIVIACGIGFYGLYSSLSDHHRKAMEAIGSDMKIKSYSEVVREAREVLTDNATIAASQPATPAVSVPAKTSPALPAKTARDTNIKEPAGQVPAEHKKPAHKSAEHPKTEQAKTVAHGGGTLSGAQSNATLPVAGAAAKTEARPVGEKKTSERKSQGEKSKSGMYQYVYQVAAFKDEKSAESLKDKLEDMGLATEIKRGRVEDNTYSRVYVTFESAQEDLASVTDKIRKIVNKDIIQVSRKPY